MRYCARRLDADYLLAAIRKMAIARYMVAPRYIVALDR